MNLVERIHREILKIPLIDPHTHIDPRRPASRSLDDLLGYHYYTELAHSTGVPADRIGPDVEPRERSRRIAAALPAIANTAQYSWLLEIARELLGFDGTRIDAAAFDGLWDAAASRMEAPGWEDEVLRRAGIEQVFLTNAFDDPLEGFDRERYIPCLRADDLVFKLHDPGVLGRLRAAADGPVENLRGLRAALEAVVARFAGQGARALAISLPPSFEPSAEGEGSAGAALSKVLHGRANALDRERLARHVLWTLADLAGGAGLPFDLMIGACRDVYPAGVPQGTDLLDRRCSLFPYRDLFNAFPRVTFPVSVLAHDQSAELLAYAWIFPNVIAHGHWWYSNVPALIAIDARARLEALPAPKQIAYYSDMYKLEFGLAKFGMYRRILASVLAEHFVLGRGMGEEEVLALARTVLRGNVERVFRLGTPGSGERAPEDGR
jgi:glucuronate isomerase